MQKGGIQIRQQFINENLGIGNIPIPVKAFLQFLYKSKCEILTYKSKGGIIFKLILNEGVVSPYELTRSNNPTEEVKEIILKFVFINDNEEEFKIKFDHEKKNKEFNYTTNKQFIDEVKIQIELFDRTLDEYLEPICPSIPFWNIYDYTYFKKIINVLLRDSDPYTTKILETIRDVSNLNKFKIGVIAMECLTGFLTLSDYQDDNPTRIDITDSMARFEIARLYKLGFIHGDLNKGNVLIHPNYKYFDGIDGRVILIDFGATFRPSELPNIDDEHLYEASKQSLLIDSPVWPVGTARSFYHFQWLRVINEENENRILKELSERRKILKDKFREHVEGYDQSDVNEISSADVNEMSSVDVNEISSADVNEMSSADVNEMSGGENDLLSLASPNNPELKKSVEIVKPQDKLELNIKDIEKENIFSILDPTHILTSEYINNYIKKEKTYIKNALKIITEIKGGKNKTRRCKTTRCKTRRCKTRRCKTKRCKTKKNKK